MSEVTKGVKAASLKLFMKELRFKMNIVENTLQTEESGNKIAFLQGNCGGYRSLCAALVEAGYLDFKNNKEIPEKTIFAFDEKEHKWSVIVKDYSDLLEWESVALDIEEVIGEARKPLESRVNKMKDRLFYEAEKGRDLHYVKGWYCILSCFDDWCAKIHEAYAIAKKDHDNSLDFGDEDDEDPFNID